MTNYQLIDTHNKDTAICSFEHMMRTHSSTYEEIIKKGRSIVPDIFLYLKENDDAGMSVMMLLTDILKSSPYVPEPIKNQDGKEIPNFVGYNVHEYKKSWLDWAKAKKII